MRRKQGWTAVALAAALVGCGGGGETVAVDEWSEGVCDALTEFTGEAEDLGVANLGSVDFEDPDAAAEAVEALQDDLPEFRDLSLGFVDAIVELGVPDVEGGDEFVEALRGAREDLVELFDDVEERVEELDPDDVDADEIEDIADDLQSSSEEAFAVLEDERFDELEEASSDIECD